MIENLCAEIVSAHRSGEAPMLPSTRSPNTIGESLVVSDHPVVLEWSDPRGKRFPPGHADIDTELSFPLSSQVALVGCYTPFDLEPAYMPAYVSGVNSRTISLCRVFVAACEDCFIMQEDGRIITSDQFIGELKRDEVKRGE